MPRPTAVAVADTDDHDHVDGCLCDVKLGAGELLADEDLPAAHGGVLTKRVRRSAALDDTNDLDGCDLDFTQEAPTGDQDLPPATGGIA